MTTATMLPNGRGAGTTESRKAAETSEAVKAALTGVPVPTDLVDAKKAGIGAELILKQAAQSGSQSRNVFNFLRECGLGKGEDAWNYADGTARLAEGMAVTRWNKILAQNEPGVKPAKNLGDIARHQGMKTLTWVQVRQRVMNAHQSRADHENAVREYFEFMHKHEGEDERIVDPNWLDLFSSRYSDSTDASGKVTEYGATKYMRDIGRSEDYKKALEAKKRTLNALKNKQAAADTGKNGENATSGMKNGSRIDRDALGDKVSEALAVLIQVVHDCITDRSEEFIFTTLCDAAGAIKDKAGELREEEAQRMSKAGFRQAEPKGEAEELPEVPDDAELSDDDDANIQSVA